jgi:hypothetical protein
VNSSTGEIATRSDRAHREIARLERVARLLDDWIAIPFTRFRIGLDPILGLVPGLGDAIAAIFSLAILGAAIRHGVPKRVVLRMAVNVALDYGVGIVPGVGDVADAFVKSNRWNLALLREHVGGVPVQEAVSRRWVFIVLGALALLIFAGLLLSMLAIGAIVRHGGWL